MKIYQNGEKIEYRNPSIALGNFDGLHMGHLKVINAAKENGESCGVLLFDTHSQQNVKLITTFSEKLELLEKAGLDFAVIVTFNDSFKNKSCREFARFLNSLGVKTVSVGYDYRCGKDAAADCNELSEELKVFDITTIISHPVVCCGRAVKSSTIREYILNGDIENANKLLTRPFILSGKVICGRQNGRLMGFPTANIELDENKIVPKDGVYVGECVFDKPYKVLLNIGKNPTFDADIRTVEAHIINFDEDIYGSEISVSIFERIRDCRKFSSPEELTKQLMADKEYAVRIKR